MNYDVILSDGFKRKFKSLSKKYRSLNGELAELISSLEENPNQGTSLGQRCYKIRLSIRSKSTGKSGGARIITYVVTEDEQVILLTIYDKKDKANLEPGELDQLLNDSAE
ncbi:type II toxin-antitoxin system RelE/ParE family toxin [Spirosoma spitsbergense]|uniref:type II toxin-antitoxin system RelE/ParE family toxin n=1 Tax=Spirosoma spitsbergense TaxID=431554 RepID=UPI000373B642|nr:type II toxin-antitoxin system RelE/ParE family toxin [Spirosoma spitsbergense]